MVLQQLRNLLHEQPQTANAPPVQDDAPPGRGVAVLHQLHPLAVPVVMDVPLVAWMCQRGLCGPGGPPEGALERVAAVVLCRSVTLEGLQGLDVSALGAEVAFVHRFLVAHHAMLGDPGQPVGVVLVRNGGSVGTFATDGVEALEVTFVGRHFRSG